MSSSNGPGSNGPASSGRAAPRLPASLNTSAVNAGFVLTAAGTLVGLCGAGMAARAIAASMRRWWQEQADPTSALMQRAIETARTAPPARRDTRYRTPAATRAR